MGPLQWRGNSSLLAVLKQGCTQKLACWDFSIVTSYLYKMQKFLPKLYTQNRSFLDMRNTTMAQEPEEYCQGSSIQIPGGADAKFGDELTAW